MRLGVVVGRFQVPDLHPGHHVLIGHAASLSDQLLIVLGVPHTRGTNNDPLDFVTRRLMVQHHYPEAHIVPLPDTASDLQWSRNLDALIHTMSKGEEDTITLYCGRDGFKEHYRGIYKVESIDSIPDYSGTALRVDARRAPKESKEFRDGVIYGIGTRYAATYLTVDVAVLGRGGVLMASRPGSSVFRFPGGFVGFSDRSLEETCHRELAEEMGLEARDDRCFEYVGTYPVDDWRYRGRPDQRIMTALFAIKEEDTVGEVNPDGTELENFTYLSLDSDGMEQVTTEHKPLFMNLVRYLDGNPSGVTETKTRKRNN